nr:site-specific integrase [uncultured Cellulosilyticum sp.]
MALEKRTNLSDKSGKKPAKWRIRVSRNGHRYETLFFGNEKEAKIAERDFIYNIDKGLTGTNENMLFKDLYQKVKVQYIDKLKINTQITYRNAYNVHIASVFDDMRLCDIKPLHIQEFATELSKTYKYNTVKDIMSKLHTCFKLAEEWELISRSPYRHIKIGKEEPKSYDELMSIEDIAKLMELYDNDRFTLHKAAFYLAIGCGLRNSEIRGLTLKDIDFQNGIINVDKQIGSAGEENGKVIATKSSNSNRKIYAPRFVLDALREHINSLHSIHINSLIFTISDNKPINSHTLSNHLREVLIANNLPLIRFHDLRHLHATLMINNNTDVATVSKRLGHKKISTTLKFYTHTIEERNKQAADECDIIYTNIKKKG